MLDFDDLLNDYLKHHVVYGKAFEAAQSAMNTQKAAYEDDDLAATTNVPPQVKPISPTSEWMNEIMDKVVAPTNTTGVVLDGKKWMGPDRTRMEAIKEQIKNINTNFILDTSGNDGFYIMALKLKTHKYCIAGGAFTSLLHNVIPRDVDYFFFNCDENIVADIHYTAKSKNTNRYKWSKTPTYKILDNSYKNNKHILLTVLDIETKAQFILTDYKDRKELIEHFDFLHCCVSYLPEEDILYISPATYDAIMAKELHRNGNNIPEDWRLEKFERSGWKNCLTPITTAIQSVTITNTGSGWSDAFTSVLPGNGMPTFKIWPKTARKSLTGTQPVSYSYDLEINDILADLIP